MPFTKGQRVRMLCESVGDDANDVERTYPVGTMAIIDDIDERGIHHVVVGPNSDESIVQCFDAGPEAEAAMQAVPGIRAEVTPYSSVVGGGVTLHDETGAVVGQLALLGLLTEHGNSEEGYKATYLAMCDRIAAAINAGQAEGQVHHPGRGATYDVVASQALFQVSNMDLSVTPNVGRKRRIVTDQDPVTVYRNPDSGMHFVRFPDEMVSPRFEKV